jgi:cytochrome b561
MSWKNSDTRYGTLMVSLHWFMLFLVVAAYALILGRELYPRNSDPRELLKAWHFTLGMAIFVLVWVRLAVSLCQEHPRIEPRLVRWQHKLSVLIHLLIYVFMIAMPVLGWLTLSAEGATALFNGISLPTLIAENSQNAARFKQWHEVLGNVGYFLIGLHAIAALYHHYFLHDDTLVRILPAHK